MDPLLSRTTWIHSSHAAPNGIAASAATASPYHHERCWTPQMARGASDGLITATNTDGHESTMPAARAAVAQITGLPYSTISMDRGVASIATITGHVHGAGRWRADIPMMIARGMAHHRISGSPSTNGMVR